MDIVERVARAICEAQALDPDLTCSDGYDTCWPLWAEFQAQAKAALEAAGVRELVEALEGMVYMDCERHALDVRDTNGYRIAARTAIERYRGEA